MRVHYLQHVAHEPPQLIEAWAVDRGHSFTGALLDEGEPVPALPAFDALVVMGGPMNVYEDARYSWLGPEKALIRAAIDGGRPILGVCLGAQLLADALGAPVSRNPEPEVGWWPVQRTPASVSSPVFAGIPDAFDCLHWHGDTFALPPGSTHLARSEACAHQAFAVNGGRLLGLQFHLEESAAGVDLLLHHARADLVEAPFVQDADTIRRLGVGHYAATRTILYRLLDNWQSCW